MGQGCVWVIKCLRYRQPGCYHQKSGLARELSEGYQKRVIKKAIKR